MATHRVGFIGLGIMGSRMAANLRRAGFELKVFNRTRERAEAWAAEHGGGVMEGRDIGTVVFPDATLKVYLTASPEARAGRRAKEVTDLDYETVAADIAHRDALDQGRADSPLRTADDAVTIDTSDLTVDEIVARVMAHLEQRGPLDG